MSYVKLYLFVVSPQKDADKRICAHIDNRKWPAFFLVPIGVASPLAMLYFDGLFAARMCRATKIVVLAYVVRPHASSALKR